MGERCDLRTARYDESYNGLGRRDKETEWRAIDKATSSSQIKLSVDKDYQPLGFLDVLETPVVREMDHGWSTDRVDYESGVHT